MGGSTNEKGVLKLVHPGRHVEYHRSSITAAEIMRKNPRHSITRPDFFKNPYIVVSPESVMVPGQVFYIVPNKTVYKLVKHRRSQQPNESPNISDHDQASIQTSPSKALAGRTPISKYQFHDHDQEQEEGSTSCEENTSDDDDGDSLTFQARDYYLNRIGPAWGRSAKYGQQGTNLKSCMKKEGRTRVSPNLRVTFDFSTMIQYY